MDVLSPYDYVVYQSERSRGSSTDSASFTKNFGTTWDTLNVYKNVPFVDWQEEIAGRTGITQTHNVSAWVVTTNSLIISVILIMMIKRSS
jgi:hypothetical protein